MVKLNNIKRWKNLAIALAITNIMLISCVRKELVQMERILPLAWNGYKKHFIDSSGRVHRPMNNNDTVSEGQAYAMLIASILDDKETFEKVFQWTENNLSRKENSGDSLLAWHWEATKGVTDWNSATDAEIDYALALILAHSRWGDENYFERAKKTLEAILKLETALIGNYLYLLPGNWRNDDGTIVINPSYLSPAHFKIFFKITGDSRWMKLVDSSYHVILTVSENFMGLKGVGLVPDWFGIGEKEDFFTAKGFSDKYGWDAIRVPWRIGIDYMWFHEDRARQYLETLLAFYTKEWEKQNEKFFAQYSYSGKPIEEHENVAAYAMSLIPLKNLNSPLLPPVLEKIKDTFNTRENYFQDKMDYYQNSLVLLALTFLNNPPLPIQLKIKRDGSLF